MGLYRVFWRSPLSDQTVDGSGYVLRDRVSRVRGKDFQEAEVRARHCFKIPPSIEVTLEWVDVEGKRQAIAEALQARGTFLEGARGFREDDTPKRGWF